MSFTITAFSHEEWTRHGLADFGEFADMITECNVGEDAFSGFGEWFFVPNDPLPNNDRVIYFGSWGNDNSPGASCYSYAEVFEMNDAEDAAEFKRRVKEWEAKPEWIEG
jgi:hypothetical protein